VIAVEELELRRRAAGGGSHDRGEIVSATSTGCGRSRSATHARPRRRRRAAASIHCTFLPGRNVRATACIGTSGTGRNNSTVNRAMNDAGPDRGASTWAMSALGATVHRVRVPRSASVASARTVRRRAEEAAELVDRVAVHAASYAHEPSEAASVDTRDLDAYRRSS
jgi:hypothetical protein